MPSDSDEATVPGDEDEIIEITSPIIKKRKKRRVAAYSNQRNPLSSSAPDVYSDSMRTSFDSESLPSSKISEMPSKSDETESASTFTESDDSVSPAENSAPPTSKINREKQKKSSDDMYSRTPPTKLSRNFKWKTTTSLRRSSTDPTERKQTGRKNLSFEASCPVIRTLFSQFKQILAENESEVMKLILVHATPNICTEQSQLALLSAVGELLLVPDQVIPTEPERFLQSFIQLDVKNGFSSSDWSRFSRKTSKNRYAGLIGPIKLVRWWHIAEMYLVLLFTKSTIFRSSLRALIEKLEKIQSRTLKRHKIFPLLFSFLTQLTETKEKFAGILMTTYCNLKNIITGFSKCSFLGVLFRITVEAIAVIMYNPRRWNIDLKFSPSTKTYLKEIAIAFVNSQLDSKYESSDGIEQSLIENINGQIQAFLLYSTNPYHSENSSRVMSWPNSKGSLVTIFNHLLTNFEKFWKFLIETDPTITHHFLTFAVVGLEALNG